jgi:hypothetical protein
VAADARWHLQRSYQLRLGGGRAELFFFDTSPFVQKYYETRWAERVGARPARAGGTAAAARRSLRAASARPRAAGSARGRERPAHQRSGRCRAPPADARRALLVQARSQPGWPGARQAGRRARAGGLTEQSWREGLAELTTLLARSRAEWKIVVGAPGPGWRWCCAGRAVAVLAPARRAAHARGG